MSGRNTIPIELSLINNNKGHRTQKVIKDRIKAEKRMQIGDKYFKPPEKILNNNVAYSKWNELVEIYTEFNFVTSSDIGTIEKYCLTYAEYYYLLECKKELQNKIPDIIELYQTIDKLKIDHNINKKLDILIKYEDRLLLNPSSRIKNVPVRIEEIKQEDPLDILGLDNV